MSCILCFSYLTDDNTLSIHDYSEVTMATGLELILKHFAAFSEVFEIMKRLFTSRFTYKLTPAIALLLF